jgi:hypothetical protein
MWIRVPAKVDSGKGPFLAWRWQPPLISSHSGKRVRDLSGVTYKGTHQFIGLYPHDLVTSQRLHLLIPLYRGLVFSVQICGGACRELVNFPSLWQNTWDNQEEKVYFGSQFQKFQFMVAWPCCFRPVAAQYIMVGGTDWGRCSPNGGWEAKRETEQGCDHKVLFKGYSPSDLTSFH